MKLIEYINEFKGSFHPLEGVKFGFDASQSEAHVDLTVHAAMTYLQSLMMSGKVSEIQNLATAGPEALRDSQYFQDLVMQCANSYYGLDWDMDRKKALAVSILAFVLEGLRVKFQSGGYESNAQGVMKFLGIDMGILGKMGGMFGRFFK
jgi:hypothetical protein